jgi:hypothetical protein
MWVCQLIMVKKGMLFQESGLELFLLLCDSASLAIYNSPVTSGAFGKKYGVFAIGAGKFSSQFYSAT